MVNTLNGEELIKRLINKQIGNNDTIIDLFSNKKYDKQSLLKMKLIEIKNMTEVAIY